MIAAGDHYPRLAVPFRFLCQPESRWTARRTPVKFLYRPVPPRFGPPRKDGWWTRPGDRRFVIKELMKLMGYWVILSLPASATRRLMRLKD
jgi:hypothetical protein